jgi:CBS domain-containing protein
MFEPEGPFIRQRRKSPMQTIAEFDLEPVVTVLPNDSAAIALERLVTSQATELYVVDAERRLLGIVPDYELLKARLHGSWTEMSVERMMSHRVVCFEMDTRIADAMKLFREGQHSRAAVVQNAKLVGQITRAALLRSLVADNIQTPPRPKFLGSELARNATTLRRLSLG